MTHINYELFWLAGLCLLDHRNFARVLRFLSFAFVEVDSYILIRVRLCGTLAFFQRIN
jgi:hypothetical protein